MKVKCRWLAVCSGVVMEKKVGDNVRRVREVCGYKAQPNGSTASHP